jgi:hypothetical protein
MVVALVAAVVGVLAGYATGGRLHHVGEHPLELWPLLLVGVVLQALAPNGVVLVTALLCLLAWCLANLQLVGLAVVAVGLALNALVIAANGAMPVRPEALERADVGAELDGTRRLEEPGDPLTVLGDVLPVRPLRLVLSFGDLIVAVGTADVVVHLMRRRRARLPAATA